MEASTSNIYMTAKHSTHKGQLIYQIAIPSPLRRLFDYLPPAHYQQRIHIGARVKVPFGRREVVAMVVGIVRESPVPVHKLKAVSEVLDEDPLLPENLMQTLLWAANYYQHSLGEVLATALPARLRKGHALEKPYRSWRVSEPDKLDEHCATLNRAKRQRELLLCIAEEGSIDLEKLRSLGFDRALLGKLESGGLVREEVSAVASAENFHNKVAREKEAIDLNDSQRKAVEKIRESKAFTCFLLDGVTGSGKTEVYLRSMEDHLHAGQQCLLLVPEIGLTPQSIQRIESRFSCPVVALHSGLSDGERHAAWRKAARGEAGIVIGTRSAVFTPLRRPGLIIIDEEHDSSFKQQDGFRYSARDIAIKRAQLENIAIVLGSATPGLETLSNARLGKYQHLKLEQRAGVAKTPAMSVIDIAQSHLDHGFSEQLLLKVEQHLADGNQVLVFINRRGYAPVLQCEHCAWISECEHCIAQMTVHARPPSLRCHHCESVLPLPEGCPDCGSSRLNTLGLGTQKLEHFLKQRFGQIPVTRIDRDSTRNKHSLDKLLEQIKQGGPRILLGTQMLAKGHHFPEVTLVAILDADLGLFSPDFRGQEHMAQTIVQVAGRAGRSEKPGEVIIQSRHGSHPSLMRLTQMPYAAYAEHLLAERETGQMPPYSHLALIQLESSQQSLATEIAARVASLGHPFHSDGIHLLGPFPAPMEKRAGRFRVHLLYKSADRVALQRFLGQLCPQIEAARIPRQVRWSVDVDPIDLI